MLSRITLFSVMIVSLTAWGATPIPDGLWRFDEAESLLQAGKGGALTAMGTVNSVAGPSDSNGAIGMDEGAALQCLLDSEASGGGNDINQYTFLFDIHLEAWGTLQPLLDSLEYEGEQANLAIGADGSILFGGEAVTGPGVIGAGEWVRIVFSVDINQLNGALNVYVDGQRLAQEQPEWWETIFGGSSIIADGYFALPNDAPTSLLATQQATATGLSCATIAYFDHALTQEEVAALATPQKPVLIDTVTDAVYVDSLAELLQLEAARYQTVLMFNEDLAPGGVRFENLLIDPVGTIVSWDEAYINAIGQMVSIDELDPTDGGYTASCTFTMPGILGGLSESMEVFLPETGGIVPIGFHAEIPNFGIEGAEVKNAYIDFYPEEGRIGGGGLLQTPTMDEAIGGSMELTFGIGPEILGYRMPDLTEFGVEALGLEIPMGAVLELNEVGAKIQNEQGLSNPVNLIQSTLSGDFQLVVPPKIPIGGRVIFPFDIKTTMAINLHDGSFSAKGTGKILNLLEVAEMDMSYDPPYNAKFDGNFDMIVFTGGFNLSSSPGMVAGMLEGKVMVPQWVPVLGGWTLADASASFANDHFRGDLSIQITPEIPSICTPQICFPNICIYIWSCDNVCWAWIFPYPCNCYTHTYCWQPPCIPPICTPAIPALKVHFGFAFDAGNDAISFNVGKDAFVYNPWETPLRSSVKAGESGTFYFMTNWYTVEAASTYPQGKQKAIYKNKAGADESDFSISESVPAAMFRLNYQEASASAVELGIQLPDGSSVHAKDGALPTGFAETLGYSRLNSDGLEQVIVLLDPPLGNYTATVGNPDDLGNYTISMSLQDHLPTIEITDISAADLPGVYDISWLDTDVEAHNTIKIYLDEDREGLDGYHVCTIEEDANTGAYRLDTTALQMHSGHYFVAIQVDDGVNAPIHVYSDAPITVRPAEAPAPVSNITYLPDSEGVHLSWDPSSSSDVVGYVVLYTDDYEDLTHFPYRQYIPAETTPLGATLTDLETDQPYLLTVCAVGESGHRSLPADIIRVTPHTPGADFPPRIVSDPDIDATATFQYHYLAQFTDSDLGGSYTWKLERGPEGMTIDPASGLVVWTPEADQAEQDHAVMLRVEEDEGDQLFARQEFEIYVYPPTIGNGIEDHNYAVASHAGMNATDGTPNNEKVFAVEGESYRYQLYVWGPTDALQFELLAGPEGMTIDASGVITWEVPAGASGQWVRIGIIAEEEHQLEHDFYLHVHRGSFHPLEEGGEGEGEDPDDCPFCCHQGSISGSGPGSRSAMLIMLALVLTFGAMGRRSYRFT